MKGGVPRYCVILLVLTRELDVICTQLVRKKIVKTVTFYSSYLSLNYLLACLLFNVVEMAE